MNFIPFLPFITSVIRLFLGFKIVRILVQLLGPTRFYSWKTFFWLGIFSWLMSSLASGLVDRVIYVCGWIFFIAAIDWFAREDKIPLRPWLTSALICIFVFDLATAGIKREALVFWPTIAGVVAAIPYFIDNQLYPKLPSQVERQRLVVLVLSQILLSCWLQFFIITQNLMADYPSLLADNLERSSFLVKVDLGKPERPKGVDLINGIKEELIQDLGQEPWSEVKERLSQPGFPESLQVTSDKVKQKVLPNSTTNLLGKETSEASLWEVESDTKPVASGYNLRLKAKWKGPHFENTDYQVEQYCEIVPVLVYKSDKESIKINCNQMQVRGWPQEVIDSKRKPFISIN